MTLAMILKKTGWIGLGLPPLVAFAVGATALYGQAGQSPRVAVAAVRAGEILREIDDPHSGERWLLVRNDANPGGPGLLLRAGGGQGAEPGNSVDAASTGAPAVPPLIRSGDRVVIEENTATVESRLEAVALTPAWTGSTFNVRLSVGGRVLAVVATGPGRAAFADVRGKEARASAVALPAVPNSNAQQAQR